MTHDELADAIEQGRYQDTPFKKHIFVELGMWRYKLDKVEVFEVLEERDKSIKVQMISRSIGTFSPFFLPKAAFHKFGYNQILHLQSWFYDKMEPDTKKNLTLQI